MEMVLINLNRVLKWFKKIESDLNADEMGELLPMIFNNCSERGRRELIGYIKHNYGEFYIK